MKYIFIFLLLTGMVDKGHAQTLSYKQLSDSTVRYYVEYRQAVDCYLHNRQDGAGNIVTHEQCNALLRAYDGYRSRCLALCKTEKQRQTLFDKEITAYHKSQQ